MARTTNSVSPRLSRRRVLVAGAAVGGGLALGFRIPAAEAAGPTARPTAAAKGAEVNAWVVIAPDETVTIRIARTEMGQGTLTGLAQLVAEELDCDWKKVRCEFPTPGQNLARNRVWRDFSTGGSRGIRGSQDYVRQAGAAARAMLVQAAAKQWTARPEDCVAAKGVIAHKPSGRKVTYGKVAEAAARLEPPKDVKLKDPKDWTIAGKPVHRLDALERVTGRLIYGTDLKLPGMLNAAIKDAPVFGSAIKSYDETKVMGMPGVRRVVRVNATTVAVVAETWWQAKKALDALPIQYEDSPHAKESSATIAKRLKEGLEPDAKNVFTGTKVGDAPGAIAGAARKVEAVYATPFLHHATMEPMNATALYTPEKCEVWSPTQNGEGSLAAASEASGLPLGKCEVYKMQPGGGFGRRGRQDYVTQAVTIAKQMPGTPVKLIWSREEDTQHGYYRPITMCRLAGGLDAKGDLVGLHVRLSGQSIVAYQNPNALRNGMDSRMFQGMWAEPGEAQIGYTVPNLLIEHAMRNTHVPVGPWRGVNTNQNAVYLECFMDELAKAAGKDPVAFRRALMAKHPKHLGILDAVAAKAGWGTPLPQGVHRGIAQHMGYGSYSAAVAEVSVDNRGRVKVHRMVLGVDCGHAVNPDQIAAQVEGSVAFGLGAAMYQAITIEGGRVKESNFHDYEIMRLAAFPKIETVVAPSGDFWGGVGEPTICVAAPSVLNAIHAAIGRPVRTLPLKNEDLRRA
jgi:isoquinoline 1-oxidoreductase beta subunit